ncbi:MAG TPA: hypothetical protein VNF68_15435 [Candidatus Baltobacteraceae bacterium]|nr:hypothetical protein [Candidatus Baltobacteraceae bacterium]
MRRLFRDRSSATPQPQHDAALVAELEARCHDLQERLRSSDEKLRERGDLLYELQQQYSVEHFGLQGSMRNLNIERMRNAGMFADRDIVLSRAKLLQRRIAELKERLGKYEPVDEQAFDRDPIVRENESQDGI